MAPAVPGPERTADVEFAELAVVMARVSESLHFPMDVNDALDSITAGVVAAVPGIDFASISITSKDGRIETLAPSDEAAVRVDKLQYELGEGPCLQAVLADPVVRVDDVATDPRWPAYGPRAAELGVGSQLAFQFRAEPHVRGGVNMYATKPHQLTLETCQLGGLFANLAAVALGWSRQDETMNEALRTRNLIGQAIGIVMERYRLTSDRAFAFLVRTSQQGNLKLYDVAAGVVADANAKAG
ncbi:GAF and ANTAR domain-containing protein [Kribbella shirazensis]|uniref:ANTAR domain-containing protein n=1 Tax=Kribbella shirazensis TaxID=1105143 RepID=A0A7X6A298_9ACTN|nr:GAF and ANTAR domain-containing protein [Kribbella shirazensis]NIK59061.1 hypothetical protein [Kribbella shirazensis]